MNTTKHLQAQKMTLQGIGPLKEELLTETTFLILLADLCVYIKKMFRIIDLCI